MQSDPSRITQDLKVLYPETEVALMRKGIELQDFTRNKQSFGSIPDIQMMMENPDARSIRLDGRKGQSIDSSESGIRDAASRLQDGDVVQITPKGMHNGNYESVREGMRAGLGPVQKNFVQYGVVRNGQLTPVSPFGTFTNFEIDELARAMDEDDVFKATSIRADLNKKMRSGLIKESDLLDLPVASVGDEDMLDTFFMDLDDDDPDKQWYLQDRERQQMELDAAKADAQQRYGPAIGSLKPNPNDLNVGNMPLAGRRLPRGGRKYNR